MNAMDGNVHRDEEILESVENVIEDEVVLKTDFGLTYSFETPWNHEFTAGAASYLQKAVSSEKVSVENSVGYVSASTS
jgi:predicted lysophospholipase L1 biosynthesis ABC-type transport system permease subunit